MSLTHDVKKCCCRQKIIAEKNVVATKSVFSPKIQKFVSRDYE